MLTYKGALATVLLVVHFDVFDIVCLVQRSVVVDHSENIVHNAQMQDVDYLAPDGARK